MSGPWDRPLLYWIDGQPIGINSWLIFEAYRRAATRVAVTVIKTPRELIAVSTIFTVSDKNYTRQGCAQLWESIQLRGPGNRQQRYGSFSWARAGHHEMVAEVLADLATLGVEVISRDDRAGTREHVEYVCYDQLTPGTYHPGEMPLHPEAVEILKAMTPETRALFPNITID